MTLSTETHPNPKEAEGGLRYNTGKIPFDLIPPELEVALARHYGKGAEKYAPRNWEKGMDWSICLGAARRHLSGWQLGETYDEETGSHHLIAAIWNLTALYVYEVRDLGRDDVRYVRERPGMPKWSDSPKVSH